LLEIADSAFDEISREVDAYSRELDQKSIEQIADLEINELSINKVIEGTEKKCDFDIQRQTVRSELIREMKKFGISTIGDLEAIMDKDFIDAMNAEYERSTTYGFVRSAMMYRDLEKYLSAPSSWQVLGSDSAKVLFQKYGKAEVEKLLKKAGKAVEGRVRTRRGRPKG
jgi:hypothetical protein